MTYPATPIRHPVNFKDAADRQALVELNADAAVVVAYGLLLPQAILDAPRLGCFNIHASLLPRWRGAAPIQRAIMAGDAHTGVCIMQMEAGLDTGPVLMRKATVIGDQDTAATLHDRLSEIGAGLIVAALEELPTAVPQPEEGVIYAKKIDKAEARINWVLPAADVDCHIRGLSPFPGAWTEINGERIKVLFSRLADGQGNPGETLNGTLRIACGTNAVDLIRLQRAGKSATDVKDFLNGFEIEKGETLD